MSIQNKLIETALKNGASAAGIARMEDLRLSPSHAAYARISKHLGIPPVKGAHTLPDNEFLPQGHGSGSNDLFKWPESALSVLVIGLAHPQNSPELDWWDGKGTLGNRILIDIIKQTSGQIEANLGIKTRKLHYYVEKGGIFLKDAAVLAGLGCIGKNNMLITPDYGPRIRFRALFLESPVPPTGPAAFFPCKDCKGYCRRVCPENAMAQKPELFNSFHACQSLPAVDGRFNRKVCNLRMEKDMAQGRKNASQSKPVTRFCRRCEWACPVGKIK